LNNTGNEPELKLNDSSYGISFYLNNSYTSYRIPREHDTFPFKIGYTFSL
jgi:hypothetical protein